MHYDHASCIIFSVSKKYDAAERELAQHNNDSCLSQTHFNYASATAVTRRKGVGAAATTMIHACHGHI